MERLEIYKLMVEMADRVSQRRQAANSFYLSITTLLVGGSAYLGTTMPTGKNIVLVSTAGILVSLLWIRAIESYRTLNRAKFTVIIKLEESLECRPFTDEWNELDPDGDGKRHRPFYKTEIVVPKVFLAMFLLQVALIVPWARLVSH